MMDGHPHIIATVEAWAACKMLLHGRHRARATSEICVTTDGSRGRTSRKVMVQFAVTRVTMSVSGARLEGRGTGGSTAVVGDNAIIITGIRLPVGDRV